MAFLNQVPASWMSKRKVGRHELGWTPFRGQPGLAARRLAVTVLRLMCEWLTHSARYLDFNPWSAVNRRLVDGGEVPADRVSRSLSKEAFGTLLAALPNQHRPGATRNGFILLFARHTGLRGSELLTSTIGDLTRTDDGWTIRVVGKGRKPRQVSVPTPAISVLREYLAGRGLPTVEVCSPSTPLLARDDAPERAPSYAAVYESFKSFVARAVRQSALPLPEADRLAKASQHWLRHTFATRWAESDGPMDVLQAELGHASPTTTAGYYTAQQRRRQREAERMASLD
jgi:integrase